MPRNKRSGRPTKVTVKRLDALLEGALNVFFQREVSAILSNVNERNNCERLAIYLDKQVGSCKGDRSCKGDIHQFVSGSGQQIQAVSGMAEESEESPPPARWASGR